MAHKDDALAEVAQKQGGKKRKQVEGGSKKVLEWIRKPRANMLHISQKLIMPKAKAIHEETSDRVFFVMAGLKNL